jgi:hypothetical protein
LKIKIEKGIPITHRIRNSGVNDAIQSLEVGDSFKIPDGIVVAGLYTLARRAGIKVTIHDRRLWRTG